MSRRVVESLPTGETFVFDDAWNEPDGRVRQIEYELKGHRRVPAHVHPKTAQTFEVLSGVLCVKVKSKRWVLRPGDQITTQPGEAHAQWNEGEAPVRAIERYDPPLDIEPFFTALPHAMSSRNPFKTAVFVSDFRAVNRPRGRRRRLVVAAFALVGRWLGLSRWYRGPAY